MQNGSRFQVVDGDGDGLQYLQNHQQQFAVGLGGPLMFINDKTTFFLEVYNSMAKYNSTGYDLRDIEGNSLNRYAANGL